MPSSAYVTSVDIESGLSTGDTLLTTATIGGAVVAGATVGIGKVAPKSIKNKIKRQKSYLKKQVEKTQENHPSWFRGISIGHAIINVGLYFFDICVIKMYVCV